MDNEIEIYKSRYLLTRVVNDLNLQISYFTQGKVIKKEVYNQSPIKLNLLASAPLKYSLNGLFNIKILSSTSFSFKTDNKTSIRNFGDTIDTKLGRILITLSVTDIKIWTNKLVDVHISPVKSVVARMMGAITVKPVNKTANVLEISMTDGVIQKAEDIINNLIKQHNDDGIEDRNQIAKNTAEFINNRLSYITSELSNVEEDAQGYKQRNNVVDVQSEAKMYLESGNVNNQKIVELGTQMKLTESVSRYIAQHNNPNDLIPANLGLADVE